MDDPGKDIFNIRLNRQGAAWILRFCRIVQVVILVSIISGFISIVHNIIRITELHSNVFISRPGLRYEYLFHPFFWTAYDLLWFAQLYLYWRFRVAMKRAVLAINENQFNNSFDFLLRITRIALVLSGMNLLSQGYALFLHFKYPV